MKTLPWISVGVVAVLLLAAAAWFNPMFVVIAVASITRHKASPNRPVLWMKGPDRAPSDAGGRPPNVVVILADDMGYNGITLHGGGVAGGAVPTPNIDSIAKDGVEFLNGYAGDATCAPSRAAILTGQYATRFGFEFTPVPKIYPTLIKKIGLGADADKAHSILIDRAAQEDLPGMDDQAIPANEATIAEVLHQRGYHTVHIGKWHLGGKPGSRPEQKGFDESLGFIPGASLYLPPSSPDAVNARVVIDPMERLLWAGASWSVQYNGSPPFKPAGYMTDYLTDQAVQTIDANRNRPFFLYFAPNAVHTPLQSTREDYDALPMIKDHTLRVYGAMTRNLDRNVGRILKALHDSGLDRNTLVIFTSDNGAAHYIGLPGLNSPYRGWKATFFEGGLHVPFFMRWPGKIAPGSKYGPPVAHVDIAATAAGVAGCALPANRINDGVDLTPYLSGHAPGAPHHNLFWRSGKDLVVIQDGWKLIRAAGQNQEWLFDLTRDPTERRDLSTAQPSRRRALEAVMDKINAQQAKPLWPSDISVPIPIDHPLGAPVRPGDTYVYWDN